MAQPERTVHCRAIIGNLQQHLPITKLDNYEVHINSWHLLIVPKRSASPTPNADAFMYIVQLDAVQPPSQTTISDAPNSQANVPPANISRFPAQVVRSAVFHSSPKHLIVAIQAHTDSDSAPYQLFDIKQKRRLASFVFNPVSYCKFLSPEVVALVTETAAFHYKQTTGATTPNEIFKLLPELCSAAVVDYFVDLHKERICVVAHNNSPNEAGQISGEIQLYDAPRACSHRFQGIAATFVKSPSETPFSERPHELLVIVTNSGTGYALIAVDVERPDPTTEFTLFLESSEPRDDVVAILPLDPLQYHDSHVMVLSRHGFVNVVDLHTQQLIHAAPECNGHRLVAWSVHQPSGGVVVLTDKGEVLILTLGPEKAPTNTAPTPAVPVSVAPKPSPPLSITVPQTHVPVPGPSSPTGHAAMWSTSPTQAGPHFPPPPLGSSPSGTAGKPLPRVPADPLKPIPETFDELLRIITGLAASSPQVAESIAERWFREHRPHDIEVFVQYAERVLSVFQARHLLKEMTAFALEVLQDNRAEYWPLTTQVLVANAAVAPQVSEAILAGGVWTHYHRVAVGAAFEQAGLWARAALLYMEGGDDEALARVLADVNRHLDVARVVSTSHPAPQLGVTLLLAASRFGFASPLPWVALGIVEQDDLIARGEHAVRRFVDVMDKLVHRTAANEREFVEGALVRGLVRTTAVFALCRATRVLWDAIAECPNPAIPIEIAAYAAAAAEALAPAGIVTAEHVSTALQGLMGIGSEIKPRGAPVAALCARLVLPGFQKVPASSDLPWMHQHNLENLLILTLLRMRTNSEPVPVGLLGLDVWRCLATLRHYKAKELGDVLISWSGGGCEEEAVFCYERAGMHLAALRILVDKLQDIPRASKYAERYSRELKELEGLTAQDVELLVKVGVPLSEASAQLANDSSQQAATDQMQPAPLTNPFDE